MSRIGGENKNFKQKNELKSLRVDLKENMEIEEIKSPKNRLS